MKRPAVVLLVIVVLLPFAYAEEDDGMTPDAVPVEFEIVGVDGVETSTFSPGETVRFVFRLRNRSNEARHFSHTFPPHRVEVSRAENGTVAWQAWQGRMFPQVMRNESIAANDNMEFSVEWQLPENIAPGEYRVDPAFHGFMQPGNQRMQEPATRTLTINP